jgi:hypothetical protein
MVTFSPECSLGEKYFDRLSLSRLQDLKTLIFKQHDLDPVQN